jgi:CRP-like cAMP-binding protein
MTAEALAMIKPIGDPDSRSVPQLAGFRLFEGVSPEAVNRFAAAVQWQRYAPGEMVFDQESYGLDVHFVMEGRIKILTALDGGEPMTLAEVAPGEIFGELAAIDRLPRSARAVAACNAVVGSIEGHVFLTLLQSMPLVTIHLLKRLAGIIRSMDVRLANTTALSPTQRVVVELLRRANPDRRTPGVWIMPVAPSHAELATWTGLDREQVAQIIGSLARDSLLRRRGGSLVLVDWTTLQDIVRPGVTRPGHKQAAPPPSEGEDGPNPIALQSRSDG